MISAVVILWQKKGPTNAPKGIHILIPVLGEGPNVLPTIVTLFTDRLSARSSVASFLA